MSNGVKTLVIFLVILVLGLVGFVVYDKFIKDEPANNKEEENNQSSNKQNDVISGAFRADYNESSIKYDLILNKDNMTFSMVFGYCSDWFALEGTYKVENNIVTLKEINHEGVSELKFDIINNNNLRNKEDFKFINGCMEDQREIIYKRISTNYTHDVIEGTFVQNIDNGPTKLILDKNNMTYKIESKGCNDYPEQFKLGLVEEGTYDFKFNRLYLKNNDESTMYSQPLVFDFNNNNLEFHAGEGNFWDAENDIKFCGIFNKGLTKQ